MNTSSQQEFKNKLDNDVKVLLSTVNSITSGLQSIVAEKQKKMTPEEAKIYAKAMSDAKISDTVAELKKQMEDISNVFNNLK